MVDPVERQAERFIDALADNDERVVEMILRSELAAEVAVYVARLAVRARRSAASAVDEARVLRESHATATEANRLMLAKIAGYQRRVRELRSLLDGGGFRARNKSEGKRSA